MLVDRDGRRVMAGAHPLADLAPRDVVSATIAAHLRRDRRRPRLPRRHRTWAPTSCAAASPASCGPAATPASTWPASRCRSCPAAHYCLRRGASPTSTGGRQRRRAVRRRRGRLHRRPGRQPAGVQLHHRGAGRRPPLRRAARRRRCRRSPNRSRRPAAGDGRPGGPDGDHRGDHPGRRRPPRRRRSRAADRRAGRRPPARRRPLDLAAVETTALHTAATLLAAAAAARTESRGCHRRTDFPDTRPEWEVRLVHRLDDAGRLHTRTEPVRTLVTA